MKSKLHQNTQEVPIKPASTLLLLKEVLNEALQEEMGNAFEVFMVVRHHEIDVAAGAVVFPGGKVEAQDSTEGILQKSANKILSPELIPFAIAAIREVFEETGILFARKIDSSEVISAKQLAPLEHYREKLVQEIVTFETMLNTEQLVLATDLLLHYAHWITPNMAPKRFDTHFFIAKTPHDQIALHDGQEAVDSVWISPKQLLKEAQEGKWKVVFPTKMNVEKLARFNNYPALENYLIKNKPLCVQPEFVDLEDGKFLCIPQEADYPRWKVAIQEVMTP